MPSGTWPLNGIEKLLIKTKSCMQNTRKFWKDYKHPEVKTKGLL
jgi:hypothetical protein